MKTVFLNPFLPTDLNEKVTSVSFKIGSFDYIAKHANVKTTEIDFDKRIIQINDDLDSTASLRELVRAFFIIVAYELNLNAEFPSGKKAHLDDIAMAQFVFNLCVYNFKISILCKKILLQHLRIPEMETGLLM